MIKYFKNVFYLPEMFFTTQKSKALKIMINSHYTKVENIQPPIKYNENAKILKKKWKRQALLILLFNYFLF